MAVKIYLYDNETDCIGSGALSSSYIQYQLEMAGGQDIEIHISSVGGSAFDAIAIYDLLKKYPGNVTTYIDSLAASAASIVAMAGKQVVMSKYALLMIHKPMVGSGGNADELLKDVEMLNAVQTRLAQIYMDKTGLDEDTVNSLINAVTWMTADQALGLGFIDSIDTYEAEITNKAIVSNYITSAPTIYQRCINKILNNPPKNKEQENTENMDKELIEKNNGLLAKVMNFFKKSVNKTVTNKGELFYVGAIAEGVAVYNDADMDTDAADDDDVEATDAAGKKVKMSIKGGKIANIKKEDESDDDDDDDDLEPENKVVLNAHGIKVVKGTERKVVINSIAGKLKEVSNQIAEKDGKIGEQNALIAELRDQLKVSNEANQRTEEDIKNKIKSEFVPESSKRSTKGVIDKLPDFAAPKSDLAKNAAAQAVKNAQ